MSKKILFTKNAPSPIGPYSQAIIFEKSLYISGQICIDPISNELKNNSVEEEVKQVMENLSAILNEAGIGFENVLKTSIFLSDMNLFQRVNEIYADYFTSDFPARETVAVSGLPKNVNVEISMIAHL